MYSSRAKAERERNWSPGPSTTGSLRKDGPFIVINCRGYPLYSYGERNLGYNQGAFTGALKTTIGKMEISTKEPFSSMTSTPSISICRQSFSESYRRRSYRGWEHPDHQDFDVRFLAGSNKDLKGLMAKERFRDDPLLQAERIPHHTSPTEREESGLFLSF